MDTAALQAVWPILDDERTLDSLKSEASEELPDLMMRQRVITYGPPSWTVKEGRDIPGFTAYDLVLVFTCTVLAADDDKHPNGIR